MTDQKDHDIVSRLPPDAVGHDGQGLGSIFQQGDVRCRVRTDQARQALAQALFHFQPFRIMAGTQVLVFPGKPDDRLSGPGGPGAHRGMIEVADIGLQNKFAGCWLLHEKWETGWMIDALRLH